MLSRVADSLYWMSRYLERAEHTARMMHVALNMSLDGGRIPTRWGRVVASLRQSYEVNTLDDALNYSYDMAFDPENRSSILTCIASARENARQVREQIPSEMWENLNGLFIHVKEANLKEIWYDRSQGFFWSVREGSHLFQGITDSTMNHGEGWYFIQLGRYLERASSTAAMLDAHLGDFTDWHRQPVNTDEYMDWVGVLKHCTAFEAYCKVYTTDLRPDWIAEFLLLNTEFPRSVCFCAQMVQSALNGVAETTQTSKANKANRLAGKLRAALGFAAIDEIVSGDMHTYFTDVQNQCGQIHNAIMQAYIHYSIESALAG
jgi:uncharacterized alpha-E superfamily protein